MADGGAGTVSALVKATGGSFVECEVSGPLGVPTTARFGLPTDETVAVIEMSAASGLHLVPTDRRDPMVTSTRGTGELIKAALDRGARDIIVGIGDSATVDGGAGMAQALGAKLIGRGGKQIGPGGGGLAHLESISLEGLDPRLMDTCIRVACDVDNPLLGPDGAARVYGPQKGAKPGDLAALEANLSRLAEIVKRDLGADVTDLPGGGAAGGLGAGLVAFLGAVLCPAAEIVIDAVDLREHLKGADLVLTGEGKLDAQTARGKVVAGVAHEASFAGVPVVALVGAVGDGAEDVLSRGLTSYVCITDDSMSLDEAFARCEELIERAAERVVRETGGRPEQEKDKK